MLNVNCRRIIANKFNEYFVTLASNLNAFIEHHNGAPINAMQSFSRYLSNKVKSSIYLYGTYDLEILDVIKGLENGKASDIPTIVIKKQQKS